MVSCARYERSSKLYEVVVHRDFCLRASPHKESRPLLKCSWERRAPFRRPGAHAEGARNAREQMGFVSRLEIRSQQNFPQYKPTGLCEFHFVLNFQVVPAAFGPPRAQNLPKAARKWPRRLILQQKLAVWDKFYLNPHNFLGFPPRIFEIC